MMVGLKVCRNRRGQAESGEVLVDARRMEEQGDWKDAAKATGLSYTTGMLFGAVHGGKKPQPLKESCGGLSSPEDCIQDGYQREEHGQCDCGLNGELLSADGGQQFLRVTNQKHEFVQ